MIDIHTHILPGVDDGAEDFDASARMLRMAAEDGATMMVATPHADFRYAYEPERCLDLLARLRASAPDTLTICSGCEVHLSLENLECVVRRPQDFTLNGLDCVLLELPDAVTPDMVRPAVGQLAGAGLRVIIAHPERNLALQRRNAFAEELVEAGCYLQLTAQSYLGGFGAAAQAASIYILTRRLAHFVATDAHGPAVRRPLLSPAARSIAKRFGDAAATLLVEDNPRAAVSGLRIANMQPAGNRLRSFFFGQGSKQEGKTHDRVS